MDSMAAPTRYPLVGLILVGMGVVIGALSYPVSQASHAVADEVKNAAHKDNVRALGQRGVKAGEKGWHFATRRGPNDNVFVDLLKAIVAILALVWCCCVCLMAFLTEFIIEPIAEALGYAAQFSVYTMAAFFVAYGLLHAVAGFALLRGRGWAPWIAQPLLIIGAAQGLTFFGMSGLLWTGDDPTYGIVALALGATLVFVCVPASWSLTRRRTPPEPRRASA